MSEKTEEVIRARSIVNNALMTGSLYRSTTPNAAYHVKPDAKVAFTEAGIKFTGAPDKDGLVDKASMADAIGVGKHEMDVVLGRVSDDPVRDQRPLSDQEFNLRYRAALAADEMLKGAKDARGRR